MKGSESRSLSGRGDRGVCGNGLTIMAPMQGPRKEFGTPNPTWQFVTPFRSVPAMTHRARCAALH